LGPIAASLCLERDASAAMTAAVGRRGGSACNFKVCLHDFECQGLTADARSEVYLHVDFAGVRAFRTDAAKPAEEPRWSFRAGFEYIAGSTEKLSGQELVVRCLSLADNKLVGEAAVDLETVAYGPACFRLTLHDREHGPPTGFVKFGCVMRMRSPDLTVICTDLRTTTQEGAALPGRLHISGSLEDAGGKASVLSLPHSTDGFWRGPCSLAFDTTLADLLRAPPCECLRFVILDQEGMSAGEASVEFRSAFSIMPGTEVQFRTPVMYDFSVDQRYGAEIKQIGELEGVLRYQNLPVCAQMVGGLCVDSHIEEGYMLIEALPCPRGVSQPPPIWKDDSEQQHFGFVLCVSPQLLEELEASGIDVKQLDTALDQLELPSHWEMRQERGRGLLARRYFSDPRARRTTWVDPRFMPEHWEQRVDSEMGRVYFQYHANKTTTYVDPRGCPSGWEMRVSKNGGAYYVHAPSMQTTFSDPRGMPSHIEGALDSQARMFFKDNNTKATSWKDPREGQQESLLAMWRQMESLRWWSDQVLQNTDLSMSRVHDDRGEIRRQMDLSG